MLPAKPKAETPEPRVICGFWRRILALAIDVLFLALMGHVLGIFFFNFLVQLGGLGLLVGFTIGLLYFGILNSAIGKGDFVDTKKLLLLR